MFSLFQSEIAHMSLLDLHSLLLLKIRGQLFCTVFFSVGLSALSSCFDLDYASLVEIPELMVRSCILSGSANDLSLLLTLPLNH